MLQRILAVFRPEEGQTTVEYALIVVGVIGVAVASFAVLEPSMLSFFGDVVDRLTAI